MWWKVPVFHIATFKTLVFKRKYFIGIDPGGSVSVGMLKIRSTCKTATHARPSNGWDLCCCCSFNSWKCCWCIFSSLKMHLGVKSPGSMRSSLSAAAKWTPDQTWRPTEFASGCVKLRQRGKTDAASQQRHKASTNGSPLIHVLFSPRTVFSCNCGTPVHIHRCRWVGDAVSSPVDEWPPCPRTATLLLVQPRSLLSAARVCCVACVSCV